MLGVLDELLYVYLVIAEASQCFLSCGFHLRFKFFLTVHYPYAASAASRRSLDHHRISQVAGKGLSRVYIGYRAVTAHNYGHTVFLHGLLSLRLVAQHLYGCGPGTYEYYTALLAHSGKCGVLRQKSEAGVYSFSPCYLTGGDYRAYIQVAVLALGTAYAHGFVRQHSVESVLISSRIYCHSLYAKLTGSTYYTHRYLASVGNKDLFKHIYAPSKTIYFMAKVISQDTAFLPPTVASALPTPIGPFTLIISTSISSVSPGTTC